MKVFQRSTIHYDCRLRGEGHGTRMWPNTSRDAKESPSISFSLNVVDSNEHQTVGTASTHDVAKP
jgi:curli biogenesis system outer membrane secretion channel CsgG